MKNVLEDMKQRKIILEKALSDAEKSKETFPEGRLRISVSKGIVRCYHVTRVGDTTGEYIPGNRHSLAKDLAQKAYNNQFIGLAREELSRLEKAIRLLSQEDADQAYQKLSAVRKKMVTPYITTDELFAAKWQAAEFKSNPYLPDAKVYDTRAGEKVRSKSEAILADMFYEMGIPYHYEKPIILAGRITRYPDFTLLRKHSREEIYLEHFGLMDNEEYLINCLNKLDEYRNCGIYPGKNLLITFESSQNPLDIKGIRKMIKDFFCV